MYKKMLVLLDGSQLAEVVFIYAQEVSGRLDINLELLHVCSPQEAEQLPMRRAYIEHMAEVLQKKAEDIRSQSGSKPGEPAIKSRGAVVVGYPAEEILKYTDANNIDLIMLSTHGRSGIKAWDLGAVADKVIHASKVPVWVVPSELADEIIFDKLPRRNIVIPLSGSPQSEAIIPHVLNLTKQRAAETDLVLLGVEADTVASVSGINVNISRIQEIESEALARKKYIEDMAIKLNAAGARARGIMLKGDPATEIYNYVKNNPTQLIAMSTHGRTGLSRMVFGSVTENLLHLLKKTPIFLVRPPGVDRV